MSPLPSVLFVGEGCTLAHFARPLTLSAILQDAGYEVALACPEAYRRWVPPQIRWLPLETQSQSRFSARLATGRPLFDRALLETYVEADLALFEEFRPELVIGDVRLSLAASARKAGVPYITLSNAYWDPRRPFPPILPCLRWTGRAPLPLLEVLRSLAMPVANAWNGRQLSGLMRAHRVSVGRMGLREMFTEADLTLYCDPPALFPEVEETRRYRFLGPIPWEPPVSLPAWWGDVPTDRPVAYVTVGSSGDRTTLPRVIEGLRRLDYTLLVATAGRAKVDGDGRRVFVADYLPGGAAAARADLVVCNGGAPTTAQAFASGKPVLGVCTNLDQFMNMRAVNAYGTGLFLRSDRLTSDQVEADARRLADPSFATAAGRLRREGEAADLESNLIAAIGSLLG